MAAESYSRYTIPTYKQLVEMLDDHGIVGRVRKKPQFKPYKFGYRGGLYLGAPGKDIYMALPNLSEEEFDDLAKRVASKYPKTPPGDHVKWAAIIRYIYGCFEKQGCLRSEKDRDRMIKEDVDWGLCHDFMGRVAHYMKKRDSKYGLVIYYEMLGHRYGDRAIIEESTDHLAPMTKCYKKAQRLALQIKSYKHTFTPFYWGGYYFYEMGEKKRAARYHKKNLEMMERYCPDSREGYREKSKSSMKQLRKSVNKKEWEEIHSWLKTCKNKVIRKTF